MTQPEQQKAAKTFAENWNGKGDEKQDSQRYWIGILGDVLGISSPQNYIQFEKRVKRVEDRHCEPAGEAISEISEKDCFVANAPRNDVKRTNFIDAYIPETKVLIEQKGIKIDLNKSYEQSDGTVLTPYQQAKRYSDELPLNLKPRWIVVSNFAEIHVHDMNKPDEKPEVIFLKDLEKDFYRLEFLVDRKNENIRREVDISVAAGALVGKMYDALVKEYINPTAESYRSLNILCVRLVFCFYAEDAGLFETRTSFEDYIKSFAIENLRDGMIKLFKALDTKLDFRDKYDTKLKPFPYVNGGLFHDENIEIPNFTQEIVDVLVNDCAPFNWSEISPTIFGAVFESTLNPETRRKGGMHYTSIENIHKVIDPLFLDDLNEEFDGIIGSEKSHNRSHAELDSASASIKQVPKQVRNDTSLKKRTAALLAFQEKLGNLTFLDPACGSGNFLTETYISLRRLENKVISALNKGEKVLGFDEFIKVKINQFYGIEINDFAVTVAKTALWIAESQMINETEKIISQQIDFLPLTTNAFIVEGNALRMDWATLTNLDGTKAEQPMLFEFSDDRQQTQDVSNSNVSRLKPNVYNYIMGNPPFVGAMWMKGEKREDMENAFPECEKPGEIDYVAAWYAKAAKLIQNTDTKCAFVSTNSISQGQQVALIWKPLFEKYHIKFDFAYRTFRWDSESIDMAHVHCVIVGFSGKWSADSGQKFIITENGEKITAQNINGYLMDADDIYITGTKTQISGMPAMHMGVMARDDGNLILSDDEYQDYIKKEPQGKKWIHRYMMGREFINNISRYCFWLVGANPAELRKCPLLLDRIEKVRQSRLKSSAKETQKLAETPTLFAQLAQPKENFIAFPKVSSEKRKYIPIGFLSPDIIVGDKIYVVENVGLYHFGILTSSVHNAWMRAVAGRLEMRYSYSNTIVYNSFAWPGASDIQKAKIEQTAQAILDARAKFSDASLADLYDSLSMPPDLRKAHEANDRTVMQAYGFNAKMTEAEVVAELFKMYERLANSK